ncbi:uncharacterized protein LOC132205698 [Neocloeon triangulifer]|uniref:uncharacterized protein LOC132205698 n=1 Tax=Neocloeon triangulifer TaxID=2078957 RepID=UPI00286ED79B|nr:uncharacterized protein LOC132205698 [Neocloeon triangulifer]
MNRLEAIRIGAAEFLGTAFLVAFGCATCTQALSKETWTIFHAAIGFGLVIATIVLVIGHISGGHINPAVSVGAAILQVIHPKMLLVYIPAQICGGIAGYGMLKAMTTSDILSADGGANGFCVSSPNPAITLTHAFMSEFFATAMLMLVVCAVCDQRNPNNQTVPLQIGLAITGLVLVIGHRSSASMNPARSFGPAFWNSYYENHWLYWVAPISGSALAAFFYRTVFGFKHEHETHKPEPIPLEDVSDRNVQTSINFKTILMLLVKTHRQTIRIAAAEFIGTAFLVAFGCATCSKAISQEPWTIFNAAIGFGLIVAMIVLVIGHISGGHINPAVSVGAAILEVIQTKMLMVYIPAQICGGIAGYGMLMAMTTSDILSADGGANGFCVSSPNSAVTLTNAFMSEFFATAMLMLVVCAVCDQRSPHNQTVPLQIGLAITGLVLVIGHRSSASMNPARSLGPAIWNNHYENHWLYWVAPIAGSALAAFFYRLVFGFEHEKKILHKPKPAPLEDIAERK